MCIALWRGGGEVGVGHSHLGVEGRDSGAGGGGELGCSSLGSKMSLTSSSLSCVVAGEGARKIGGGAGR